MARLEVSLQGRIARLYLISFDLHISDGYSNSELDLVWRAFYY